MWKLSSHFLVALLPSGHWIAIAIVELHRHRLGLPPFYLGLQLYHEMKCKCMRPLNHIFAYHIVLTTLADGDYELILEPEGGYSEDPETFVKEFSEAPNQGSEDNNLTYPSPASEGKPRT
jgi:hypothetical protein